MTEERPKDNEASAYDNTDELFKAMRQDELGDTEKLTPRDFADLVGVTPQLIYYHINAKHISIEKCQCGRKVVDVAEALKYWNSKPKQKGQQ
jgi:hypothetical protein